MKKAQKPIIQFLRYNCTTDCKLHLESNAQTENSVSAVIEVDLVACSSCSLYLSLVVVCVHVTEIYEALF